MQVCVKCLCKVFVQNFNSLLLDFRDGFRGNLSSSSVIRRRHCFRFLPISTDFQYSFECAGRQYFPKLTWRDQTYTLKVNSSFPFTYYYTLKYIQRQSIWSVMRLNYLHTRTVWCWSSVCIKLNNIAWYFTVPNRVFFGSLYEEIVDGRLRWSEFTERRLSQIIELER